MRRSKENNPGSIAAPNGQDRSKMDGVEVVKGMEQNQRRALSSIDQNIIGASLHHPGLVNNREFRGYFRDCHNLKLHYHTFFNVNEGFIFISSVLDRKDEVCNKKSALEEKPDNRRSLAVERVTNQDHFLEETKNRTQFTVKPGSLDDIEISDLEECEDDNDVAVPIFVKHTEAALDETDGMDIEMEDMEDSIIDIDCSDSNDPLVVVEYVDGIYASLQGD